MAFKYALKWNTNEPPGNPAANLVEISTQRKCKAKYHGG
jgi:hypothetical protein